MTDVDAAHKLLVLARRAGQLAADLGMMAGTVHDDGEHDASLLGALTVVRVGLEAVASGVEKVERGLDDGAG
jgi:hypothetical protein